MRRATSRSNSSSVEPAGRRSPWPGQSISATPAGTPRAMPAREHLHHLVVLRQVGAVPEQHERQRRVRPRARTAAPGRRCSSTATSRRTGSNRHAARLPRSAASAAPVHRQRTVPRSKTASATRPRPVDVVARLPLEGTSTPWQHRPEDRAGLRWIVGGIVVVVVLVVGGPFVYIHFIERRRARQAVAVRRRPRPTDAAKATGHDRRAARGHVDGRHRIDRGLPREGDAVRPAATPRSGAPTR